MATSSIWLDLDRLENFKLTTAYDDQCLTFLSRKPKLLENFMYILYPFSRWLWLTLAIIIILYGLVYKIIRHLSIWNDTQTNGSTIYLNLFGLLTNHPSQNIPNDLKYRIVICSWAIMACCVANFYSTKFAATLTNKLYSPAIDTYDKFINTPHSMNSINYCLIVLSNNLL